MANFFTVTVGGVPTDGESLAQIGPTIVEALAECGVSVEKIELSAIGSRFDVPLEFPEDDEEFEDDEEAEGEADETEEAPE